MRVSLVLLSLALAAVDAATRVAVLEVGPKTGMVHRTEVKSSTPASTDGVISFWSAVHGYGRKLQHEGMTVVPDLFRKPDAGLVISVKNVDLESLPSLQAIMSEEGTNGVVGHMEIPVAQNDILMKKILSVEEVSSPARIQAPTQTGLFGVKVTGEQITDEDVRTMLASLRSSNQSVVVHIVVEEEESVARRRLASRRLEDAQEEADENGNNGNNANGNNNNGFYGYGYYNSYNEWVTPYKTMFQIQYFNVVLWTSIVLVLTLIFSIYLMIYMPLMSDTLLFGEAARMVGDE